MAAAARKSASIALIVSTIARGGGPIALGVLLGILFALTGAGRLYLASKTG